MKRNRIFLGAFLLLSAMLVSNRSFAQHPVIFETFTNSYDLCNAPNPFDALFKSTISSKGSKIIHFNHHIGNLGDPMAQVAVGSDQMVNRLADLADDNMPYPVFVGAVDRQIFGSTGNRESGSGSDWNDEIDAVAGNPAPASITLVNATYDQTQNSYNFLHADIDVTSLVAITDNISIHYAILEDNVSFKQCNGSGPSVHNDVVRFITLDDSVLALTGKPAGTTVHVSYTQRLPKSDPRLKPANQRLIAFLQESTNSSDYHIVNAAELKKDFDTLKGPPQLLQVQDTALDGKSFTPGSTIKIPFQFNNVRAVDVYYSLDNGTTWRGIATTASTPFSWLVPDSATTKGKIKLVNNQDNTTVSIEKGNFTIAAAAHSLTLLKPTAGEVDTTGNMLSIVWTRRGVNAVMVTFSPDFGTHWDTLSQSVTDTSYLWKITAGATTNAIVRLIPIGVADVPAQTSDAFKIIEKVIVGVNPSALIPSFGIQSVYPNPLLSGDKIGVDFTLDHPHTVQLQMLDLLGREVVSRYYSSTVTSGKIELSTTGLGAGTYILRLNDGENSASRRIEIVR